MQVRSVVVLAVFAGTLFVNGTLFAQTTSAPPPAGAGKAATSSTQPVEPIKVDSAKEADIRRLMDLVGISALGTQMMDEMRANIKPLMASALPSGEYREKLAQLFFEKFRSKVDGRQVIDLSVPIYDKYYTHQEIRGLIEFYQTPLGQKTISVLPQLMGELQSTGRQWGEKLGRECMMQVLAEHPELAKALDDAKREAQPH